MEVRQFSDKFLNLVEEIENFERGEGVDFTFFSKTFFDPLFYYLSEYNLNFGLV